MQNGLAGLLAESILKVLAVVGGEEVPGDGLTTVLVYSLQNLAGQSISLSFVGRWASDRSDLVTRGVTETGEEGEELGANGGRGLLLEDDLVELGGTGDLEARLISIGTSDDLGAQGVVPWSGCSSDAWQWCRPGFE